DRSTTGTERVRPSSRCLMLARVAPLGIHIHIFVRWRLGYDLLVLLRGEFRQLLQERNHAPDGGIVVTGAPGGHAAHLDAVLDCPESISRVYAELREIRWLRIHSLADFRVLFAVYQVTAGAHRSVLTCAFEDELRVVEIRRSQVPG